MYCLFICIEPFGEPHPRGEGELAQVRPTRIQLHSGCKYIRFKFIGKLPPFLIKLNCTVLHFMADGFETMRSDVIPRIKTGKVSARVIG